MNFHAFKEWVALGLMAGGVWVLWTMNQNIGQLNITMAVITEKVLVHDRMFEKTDRTLEKHGTEIEELRKR